MAIVAYPFDAQDITEAQYGALQSAAMTTGVVAAPSANDYKVTATGSNLILTVTAVGANSLALVRGHAVQITENEPVTLAAADTGARVDLVVMRLNYATNTIAPLILKGTSGSSTPPSPSWGAGGFYDLPLARVAVGANVLLVSNANVTDARRFTGMIPGSWPTISRPSTPSTIGWNTTDSRWEYTIDGSTWLPLTNTVLTDASVTGTLPVSKGGTGQTTTTAALNALGIYVQSTQPAYAAGRVWIKIP